MTIKFGTSGFRSAIGEGFTQENIQKIVQALAKQIKIEKSTQPVIIGYDRRFLSDRAAAWAAEVLAGNNIKVKLFTEPVPTPAVMYGVKAEDLDYGITITASHNPYYDNGIKICVKGGADANNTLMDKLFKIIKSNPKVKTLDLASAKQKNLVVDYDNTKDYLKNITKFVSKDIKDNNLKVLFNAMHGVCAPFATTFAKMLKIEKFTLINDSMDPYFEHSLPAPNENCLEEFKKQVVKGRYSIGLAVDADGDRLGIIDENGEYYSNNIIMAICYYYLIKYRGLQGDIVKNCATSSIIDRVAEHFGYKCHEVPVGFKYISAKMKEVDALIGGESSGGLTMRGYTPAKDSFFSIAILLDAMATIKKPLSKIAQLVKEECGYISTYVEKEYKGTNRKKLTKALTKTTPNFSYKPKTISRIDGTKYTFEDGSWVLIRYSGTESLLRYHLEFSTEIECERNEKAIINYIEKYGK